MVNEEVLENAYLKTGITIKEYLINIKKIGIDATKSGIFYRKRSGKELKELYCKSENSFLKELILNHPDCPKELKVAEEL